MNRASESSCQVNDWAKNKYTTAAFTAAQEITPAKIEFQLRSADSRCASRIGTVRYLCVNTRRREISGIAQAERSILTRAHEHEGGDLLVSVATTRLTRITYLGSSREAGTSTTAAAPMYVTTHRVPLR